MRVDPVGHSGIRLRVSDWRIKRLVYIRWQGQWLLDGVTYPSRAAAVDAAKEILRREINTRGR